VWMKWVLNVSPNRENTEEILLERLKVWKASEGALRCGHGCRGCHQLVLTYHCGLGSFYFCVVAVSSYFSVRQSVGARQVVSIPRASPLGISIDIISPKCSTAFGKRCECNAHRPIFFFDYQHPSWAACF